MSAPQTALLVIDVQNIYAAADSPLYVKSLPQSLARINELVDAFVVARRPVIYVRHVHRADGRDAGRMFDFGGTAESVSFCRGRRGVGIMCRGWYWRRPGLHMIKRRYSCFEGTELEAVLHSAGVHTVAICGYMTNFCCESTARAAHDRDYFVDFIADATGAPALGEGLDEARIVEGVTATLAAGFARIYSTEAYLERISAD